MRHRPARIVLLAYVAVLGVGVFGSDPGEEIDAAAKRLRDLEQEVRGRVGGSTTTTWTVPAAPTPSPADPPATRPPTAAPTEDRWFDDLRAEPFFNVVVFVPLGLLFPMAWPRWGWLTVLLGAQMSGAIELVQDVFLGWRSPTVDDVRWNTLGTVIGFGIWLAVRVAAPRTVARLSASGPLAPAGYSGNIPRRGSSV